jgi:hypothetical protein
MTLSMNQRGWAAGVLAAMLLAHVAGAAAQTATSALRACRAETDDAKRLACYDREMARMVESEHSAPAAATAARPPAEPPPSSATERFGLPPERIVKQDAVPSKLTARVSSVSQRAQGRYLITLDNGQVWLQMEDSLGFAPQAGGSVTVTRGMTGAYYMADKHYVVSVRRMQ